MKQHTDSVVAEMATNSKDCGFMVVFAFCLLTAGIAWASNENGWIVLATVFVTLCVCWAIGRSSVRRHRDRMRQIKGDSFWEG